MAADLNAVIKGARSAGADEFVILDFHGSSPPRPNLRLKDIDPEAKLLSGRGHFGLTQDVLKEGYDVMFIVGMHAMDGVADGILRDKFTSTFKYNTNGLLRQYFHKRTDLSGFAQTVLDAIANITDSCPHKHLGWKCPAEPLF